MGIWVSSTIVCTAQLFSRNRSSGDWDEALKPRAAGRARGGIIEGK